ncbi:MAG: polysaccharide biosynthesis tyrosine autokinase [Oscillatoriophycideae cyanobacterium NC_groundwater_1537_Pr4_S-0.65um_50_18]|nr:polysaccharide biosynthesis tyrosine autokinase [Oscillatoriophycideae cyanobacterium NC_groundwater_1537_Pr4_S-0.65um_50_18]
MKLQSDNQPSPSSNPLPASPLMGSVGQPQLIQVNPPATPAEEEEQGLTPAKLIGMVRRKFWVVGIAALATSAFMGFQVSKQVPQYQGSFSLLVEPVVQRQRISSTLADDKSSESSKEFDYSSQIQVLISPKTLVPILKKINDRYSGVSYDELSSKLLISRFGETKIIEISYSGTDPIKVKFILEKLSEGYLSYSLQDQKATLQQGIQFVDHQLPGLKNRVSLLQKQIESLRQQYNFVDPDIHAQELSVQLTTVAQQRHALQDERVGLQIQYAALQQQAGASAALDDSKFYQDFLHQFQALDRQIAIESARFGKNNPTIQLLRQQQDNLRPLLIQEAGRSLNNQIAKVFNGIQILNSREQALAAVEKSLDQQFKQMPSVSRQFADLQRELKTATDSLNRFQTTRESLQIQSAQNEIPWQLIAPPKDPKSELASNVYKSLMTGGIGGIILGVGVVFLLEKLENAFYSIADLKKRTKLPILGVIPYRPNLEHAGAEVHVVDSRSLRSDGRHTIKENSATLKERMKLLLEQGISNENSSTETISLPGISAPTDRLMSDELEAYAFLESFRALHTSIIRLDDSQPISSVVISSAMPVEGRTTIAVHLAQAAAAMGKRVLLVDAHFRRGGVPLHTLLGLPDREGLSDFLNETASLNQVIQRLAWESSLFVVAAGSSPPDPTRLLSSARMNSFMHRVHKAFDLVIYDTPPLMGLADVSLIAAQTNGVVLVAGFGKRNGAEALTQTIERLKTAHIPILGVVANGVKNYSVDLYNQ